MEIKLSLIFLVCVFQVVLSYPEKQRNNHHQGDGMNTMKLNALNKELLVDGKTPTDDFFKMQLQVIKAYSENTALQKRKRWSCSYDDHVKASLSFVCYEPEEETRLIGYLNESLRNPRKQVVVGGNAIASTHKIFEVIYIWEEVYLMALEYRNVLYGGIKTEILGLGTKYPLSFYEYSTNKLLYYDLWSCVPLPEYIHNKMYNRVEDVLVIKKDRYINIRNSVNGIVGILQENVVVNDTANLSDGKEDHTTTDMPIGGTEKKEV